MHSQCAPFRNVPDPAGCQFPLSSLSRPGILQVLCLMMVDIIMHGGLVPGCKVTHVMSDMLHD